MCAYACGPVAINLHMVGLEMYCLFQVMWLMQPPSSECAVEARSGQVSPHVGVAN